MNGKMPYFDPAFRYNEYPREKLVLYRRKQFLSTCYKSIGFRVFLRGNGAHENKKRKHSLSKICVRNPEYL
jgi:hypothetical protein